MHIIAISELRCATHTKYRYLTLMIYSSSFFAKLEVHVQSLDITNSNRLKMIIIVVCDVGVMPS